MFLSEHVDFAIAPVPPKKRHDFRSIENAEQNISFFTSNVEWGKNGKKIKLNGTTMESVKISVCAITSSQAVQLQEAMVQWNDIFSHKNQGLFHVSPIRPGKGGKTSTTSIMTDGIAYYNECILLTIKISNIECLQYLVTCVCCDQRFSHKNDLLISCVFMHHQVLSAPTKTKVYLLFFHRHFNPSHNIQNRTGCTGPYAESEQSCSPQSNYNAF